MNHFSQRYRAGGKSTIMYEINKLAVICRTGRKDGNRLGKRKLAMYCGVLKVMGANPNRALKNLKPTFMILDDIVAEQGN